MKDFDVRQLNIMIDMINDYRSDVIELSDLIYNLEAILNCLEDRNLEWENQFRRYWANLEIVYAVSLTNEQSQFDSGDIALIRESLEKLTTIIKQRLNIN